MAKRVTNEMLYALISAVRTDIGALNARIDGVDRETQALRCDVARLLQAAPQRGVDIAITPAAPAPRADLN